MSEQIETKDCPYCGEKINVKAVKCKHCKSDINTSVPVSIPSGLQVNTQAISQNADQQKCSKCGMMIPLNIKRCPHCNEDLKPGCLKVFFMALGAILLLWFTIKVLISGFTSH